MPTIDPVTLNYVPDPVPEKPGITAHPPYEITVDTIAKAPAKDRPAMYEKLKDAKYTPDEIARIKGMVEESLPKSLFALPLTALAIGAAVLYFVWKPSRRR